MQPNNAADTGNQYYTNNIVNITSPTKQNVNYSQNLHELTSVYYSLYYNKCAHDIDCYTLITRDPFSTTTITTKISSNSGENSCKGKSLFCLHRWALNFYT